MALFFIRITGKASQPHPDHDSFFIRITGKASHPDPDHGSLLSGSRVRVLIRMDHDSFFIRITGKASPPHPDHGSFLIPITSKSSYPRSSVSWLFFSLDPGQGVTKRCRLSWLTNSALVYESKCGEDGGIAESQPMSIQLCTSRDMEPK
jgi:hypothetical protein